MTKAKKGRGLGQFTENLDDKPDRFDKMLKELDWRVAALGKFDKDAENRKEGRKTRDKVFDRLTLRNIYKLFTQGWLESVDFPIAPGKEAVVYCGTGGEKVAGNDVAVKIYNTGNAVFRGLLPYIEGDPRFRHFKKGHRNTVNLWVAKEFKNLLRLEDAGIRVPHPWAYRGNVLVMEYLGTDTQPASQVRIFADKVDWEKTTETLIELLRAIYQKANLVHADFSVYNLLGLKQEGQRFASGPKILGHNGEELGEMVLIDVGQAVPLEHPGSREFLDRDLFNLVKYLGNMGIELDVETVFKRVTET